MATRYSPKIVTDNLILCLDAGSSRSYSGSGGWKDLSNVNHDGTITGATFVPHTTAAGAAHFDFDGINDYVDISSSSDFAYGTSDFAWEFWVNSDDLSDNDYLIDHGSNGGTLAFGSSAGNRYYNATTGTGSSLYTTGFGTMSTSQWYHLVATRISGTTYLYKNTVLTISASDSHNYAAQAVRIGRYGGATSGYNWNGKICCVRLYKGKGLTAAQVEQNYIALKGRFNN